MAWEHHPLPAPCGYSSMIERRLAKSKVRVKFSLPAPYRCVGKLGLIRVAWDDEIARSNRVTPTKTDITKVQRKKRRNAMLSNSIKLEQVNTEIRCDSLMAFWYTAEGPSYIKS